jgi:MFS family permease
MSENWRAWFRQTLVQQHGGPRSGRMRIAKPFVVLWIGAFLLWISFYMASAVLPLYARSGGASDIEVGIIVGVLTLVSAAAAPLGGSMADRFGRRHVMLCGAIAFTLCAAGYAWSALVIPLVAFRALHGVGMGLYTSANSAAAADLGPAESRGARIGLMGATVNLGLAIAPMLGLALAQSGHFDSVFAISVALAAIAVVLMSTVGETLGDRGAQVARSWGFSRKAVFPALVGLCLMAPFGVQFAFVPLYAGAEGLGAGVFFAAMALVIATVRMIGGWLSDRIGRALVTAGGLGFAGAGLLVLAFVPGLVGLAVAGLLYGIGFGVGHPALMAWSVDGSSGREYGKALGTYLAAHQLGFALGSMAGGAVITALGYRAAFVGAAVLVLAAVLPVLRRHVQDQRFATARGDG